MEKCYKYFGDPAEKKKWSAARYCCRSYKGFQSDLVTITNLDINDYLKQKIKETNKDREGPWIGLRRKHGYLGHYSSMDGFYWSSGSKFSKNTFSTWNTFNGQKEPNNKVIVTRNLFSQNNNSLNDLPKKKLGNTYQCTVHVNSISE